MIKFTLSLMLLALSNNVFGKDRSHYYNEQKLLKIYYECVGTSIGMQELENCLDRHTPGIGPYCKRLIKNVFIRDNAIRDCAEYLNEQESQNSNSFVAQRREVAIGSSDSYLYDQNRLLRLLYECRARTISYQEVETCLEEETADLNESCRMYIQVSFRKENGIKNCVRDYEDQQKKLALK